ncbi:hypothetical protein GMES_0025 [Paraglaciecola mesophila KMM 241]|uniref:Uncharacterized protein n=1 Tax=Paraglaciecola mesophila KMM 241 TaxID=1128912 RepID=K6ZG23_9ALTE|nr:hypothetical protein GMES_0025 [Paraglaciecola mesophila KMM 241]
MIPSFVGSNPAIPAIFSDEYHQYMLKKPDISLAFFVMALNFL